MGGKIPFEHSNMKCEPMATTYIAPDDVLHQVLETVPFGFVVVRETGEILFINESARNLFALDHLSCPCQLDQLLVGPGCASPTLNGSATELMQNLLHAGHLTLPTHHNQRVRVSAHPGKNGYCALTIEALADTDCSPERRIKDKGAAKVSVKSILQERLEAVLASITHDSENVALLQIEIEGLRRVNEKHGHLVRQKLIESVVARISSAIGSNDVLIDMGGGELAIIHQTGELLCRPEALAKALGELVCRPFLIDTHVINASVSAGIALQHGQAAQMMKNAETALTFAKVAGINGVRIFVENMAEQVNERSRMEFELRKALRLRQFEILYISQHDLKTQTTVGFEAQLYWRHPRLGLLPSRSFMPLAEEIGVVGQLGEWALKTACRDASCWEDGLTVAVNVPPSQFHSRALVRVVSGALTESGLEPDRLELEVTESTMIENDREARFVMLSVKALGVRISVDEFGTGSSSLTYLRSFPFDKIKIDGAFIQGTGKDCEAIVRAVTSLGSSLGIATSAEGVETEEQMERSRNNGFTQIQGLLVGNPLSAAEVTNLFPATQFVKAMN